MSFLFGRSRVTPLQAAADRLHDALVAQVRTPFFFTDLQVPDTFEGRFDLLVLHATLVLRRLRALGSDGQALAQVLVDTMFRRFDIGFREAGVSDIGVPKRMKRLAEAFKGRTAAYEQALAKQDGSLAEAVSRNVVALGADGAVLALYSRAVARDLEAVPLEILQQAHFVFPDPSGFLS